MTKLDELMGTFGFSEEALRLMQGDYTLNDVPISHIKTQKARGVRAYNRNGLPIPGVLGVFPNTHSELSPMLIPHNFKHVVQAMIGRPIFARPCPTKPRHGFVDSRIIHSTNELRDLYKETIAEDPKGEIILMEPYDGKRSAVMVSKGVSWGLGHDGVTGGGETVTIPTPGTSEYNWKEHIFTRYSFDDWRKDIPDAAYVEVVEHEGRSRATQVRNGPEQPSTVDYIPQRMKVKNVITVNKYTSMGLLEWEKKIKQLATKPDGWVIYIENGSLASHYAVHALQFGLPVMTSREPRYNETLEPSSLVIPKLSKKDLVDLQKRMRRHSKMSLDDYNQMDPIITAIATVHGMSQWDNSPHLQDLRALAMVLLPRYTAAATMGEMRHWNYGGPGTKHREGSCTRCPSDHVTKYPMPSGDKFFDQKIAKDRNAVYERMLNPYSPRQLRRFLEDNYTDFSVAGWSGSEPDNPEGPTGYGGRAWAAVARAGVVQAKALQDFMEKPTHARWHKLVLVSNVLVHTAHNNGAVFTKWVNATQMANIARAAAFGFGNNFAGIVALEKGKFNV